PTAGPSAANKGRANLLAGLRDGSLEKVVTDMENAAEKPIQEEPIQEEPAKEEPAKEAPAKEEAVASAQSTEAAPQETPAVTAEAQQSEPTAGPSAVGNKARANLLAGLRDGSLEKVVTNMENAAEEPIQEEPAKEEPAKAE
ncbi:unnamed protein product, partial [Polarella glacialis]